MKKERKKYRVIEIISAGRSRELLALVPSVGIEEEEKKRRRGSVE
jgi:hypothetical protein